MNIFLDVEVMHGRKITVFLAAEATVRAGPAAGSAAFTSGTGLPDGNGAKAKRGSSWYTGGDDLSLF